MVNGIWGCGGSVGAAGFNVKDVLIGLPNKAMDEGGTADDLLFFGKTIYSLIFIAPVLYNCKNSNYGNRSLTDYRLIVVEIICNPQGMVYQST